jgi:hypothetical protein
MSASGSAVLASGLAAILVAFLAAEALGAPSGRRPPPSTEFCSTHFEGRFVGTRPGERSSYVFLCPGDSRMLVAFRAGVPVTCRLRGGGVAGPEKGVNADVDTLPRSPIRTDGSFAFTIRLRKVLGVSTTGVLRVRGVFDGTSVKGRARLTSGAWWRYTSCTGDARFRASLKRD